MRDRVTAIVRSNPDQEAARSLVREYLQHYVLYLLFRTKHYQKLAFTGGTALRILFELPRFSEDLDFSLLGGRGDFDFPTLRKGLFAELSQAGYQIDEKASETRNVLSAFIKFRGLLFQLGLTPHRHEVMSIKLEIDSNPPPGERTETTVVNKYHMMYYTVHYDLPTLFAGKLHALCFRRYTKGHDLYDLLWFLSSRQGIEPNLSFLNNAAAQTERDPPIFKADNWRSVVEQHLKEADMERARQQIRPFLERPEESEFLTLQNLSKLLHR